LTPVNCVPLTLTVADAGSGEASVVIVDRPEAPVWRERTRTGHAAHGGPSRRNRSEMAGWYPQE
jgi:hypothetical protein